MSFILNSDIIRSMKKIELDVVRTLITFLFLNAFFCLLKMNLKDSAELFLLISTIGTPIVAFLLILRRSRKAGLYFSPEGVTYNNGIKTYFSSWDKVDANVSLNLGIFKEITLTLADKKTVTFGSGWVTKKDLTEASPCIPKDHILQEYLK